jgi:hypothetical protein
MQLFIGSVQTAIREAFCFSSSGNKQLGFTLHSTTCKTDLNRGEGLPACAAEWTKDEGKDGCEDMLSTFRFSTCTIRDGSNTVEHTARFKQKMIVRFTYIPMT